MANVFWGQDGGQCVEKKNNKRKKGEKECGCRPITGCSVKNAELENSVWFYNWFVSTRNWQLDTNFLSDPPVVSHADVFFLHFPSPWTTSAIWSLPSFLISHLNPPPNISFHLLGFTSPTSSTPPPSLSFLPLILIHLSCFAFLPRVRWLQTTDFLSHPWLCWIMQQPLWTDPLFSRGTWLIRGQDPLHLGWGQWPYGFCSWLFEDW